MKDQSLPGSVVETDNRLETAEERSRQALAKHRWHWTLDESNPDRVTVAEYARAIGRGDTTVRDMVNGYAAWESRGAPGSGLTEDLARAKMRGETLVVAEAVAQARGISLESARRHHAEEVREVRATAQERAERNASTVEEEAPVIARQRQSVRTSQANQREEKAKAHTLRYIGVEGKVSTAMRSLKAALDEAEGVEFTAEERELLGDSLGKLRALLNLLDVRIVGVSDIDWDAEWEKVQS